MTVEELEAYLARPEPAQRAKLQQLRAAHVAAIRALPDDGYQRAIRAIKKRLGSPKLADELAVLLHELSDGRATKPVEVKRAEPAPVPWVGTAGLDPQAHALEAAIAADPEAQEPYTVLGDYLTSNGDVRGELIAIGQALAKNPTHKAMRTAWNAWVATHRQLLWGELAGTVDTLVRDVDWYMGFVRACRVQSYRQTTIAETLGVLLDEPGPGRFVQRLAIASDPVETFEAAGRVLARRPRPTVRVLSLGQTWGQVGDVSALWPAIPNVRELRIEGNDAVLGDVRAPALERFAYEFGPARDGMQPLDGLAALWAGDGVPNLRALALTSCDRTDALCEALVRSPLVERLVDVDLSQGTMSAAGAAVLHAHRDRLRGVRRWNFELNYLTADACAQLAELGGEVIAGDQREDTGDRYAAPYE